MTFPLRALRKAGVVLWATIWRQSDSKKLRVTFSQQPAKNSFLQFGSMRKKLNSVVSLRMILPRERPSQRGSLASHQCTLRWIVVLFQSPKCEESFLCNNREHKQCLLKCHMRLFSILTILAIITVAHGWQLCSYILRTIFS